MTARWSARRRMADAWVINPHAKLSVLERQMAVYRRALVAAGRGFPGELPIIKELYVAPDRRTALAECRPFLEAKYKAYASWGQDKALPEGDTLRPGLRGADRRPLHHRRPGRRGPRDSSAMPARST